MATATKRKRVRLICQSCYEPENFDDMVNCGKCHEWSHFCCAVVGPKIKDEEWICNRCKVADMAKVKDDISNLTMCQKAIQESVFDMHELSKAALATFTQNMQEMKASNDREIAAVQHQVQKLQMVHDVDEGASAIVHETETMKESNAPNVRESIPPNAFQMSMLPTKSLDELNDLLTYVESDDGFSQFKLHISSLCGNDAKKSVRNIVFVVMDKNVQKQLSWSGLRTTKPSFPTKYKRIVDAISETLDGKFKDYNYDILKKKVTTLLQNAEY